MQVFPKEKGAGFGFANIQIPEGFSIALYNTGSKWYFLKDFLHIGASGAFL